MGALTLAILLCDTEFDKLQTGIMLAKKYWRGLNEKYGRH